MPEGNWYSGTGPNQFTFVDAPNQQVSTTVTSDPVTLAGMIGSVSISVSGSSGAKYSINGGSFTAVAGTVSNGDAIRAQVTASALSGVSTAATVTVGSVSDTFTVTTSTDPFYSSVVALLHFNGADGSTTFTDQTGKIWTPNGNAQIDTAQSEFGGASGLFDGSGDFISTPQHTDFDITSGDFTLEMWLRPAVLSGTQSIVSKVQTGSNGWILDIGPTGRVTFTFIAVNNWLSASGISAVVWSHVAVTRSGNTLRHFINGILDATNTISNGIVASAITTIGETAVGTPQYYNGWIDDLRITKGVARYTANFTPPAQQFPDA